jgi:predicted GNAT family acetyltransferase
MTGVNNNTANSRFELEESGATTYADYSLSNGVLSIKYVFAPESLRGTGAAGRLMDGIVLYARENNLKIMPICGYAVSWLRRHSETADLQA